MVSETLLIFLPIYFNVSVYKEVRGNNKQIADNQVSLEAKEKLLKKKESFLHNNYRSASYFTVLYSIKYLFYNCDLFQRKNLSQYNDSCFVCFLFVPSSEFVV